MVAVCRRRIALFAVFVAASLLVARPGTASAQAVVTACQSVEHRQFDFWVGHWEVFVPSGKKAGENTIQVIADGCALLEEWSGGGGVTGKSLNIYDPVDHHWHQTWVDNSGTLLMLSGGFAERSMVMSMTGPSLTDPARTVRQRITWTPAADGSVRQLWESSLDGGTTWTVLFDGHYVRVP
ncbi:MAG TPA: hypothetical protein VH041_12905 [Caldimonas sp.]|jgi:hypothetical protein|nr:hypothetical protein [Caldimonas sp.]HEX4235192.1 hypothetical protein [Caldimonas sp.]